MSVVVIVVVVVAVGRIVRIVVLLLTICHSVPRRGKDRLQPRKIGEMNAFFASLSRRGYCPESERMKGVNVGAVEEREWELSEMRWLATKASSGIISICG